MARGATALRRRAPPPPAKPPTKPPKGSGPKPPPPPTGQNPVFSGKLMVSDTKARIYSAFLQELELQLGHSLTVDDILEAARPEDSPIHDFFEWDSRRAHEKFLRQQARQLMSVCYVKMVDYKGRRVPARQWVNLDVEEGEEPERTYVSTTVVRTDPSLRSRHMKDLLRDLRSWFDRARTYREFSEGLEFLEEYIPRIADHLGLNGSAVKDKK